MIQLPQGFKINSREPIDVRFILTKTEMLAINESTMPDIYFAICKDDGKLYIYQKSNEILEDVGKYRLYGGNADAKVSVSKEQNNRLIENEDGLFVKEPDSVPIDTIIEMFLNSKEKEPETV